MYLVRFIEVVCLQEEKIPNLPSEFRVERK